MLMLRSRRAAESGCHLLYIDHPAVMQVQDDGLCKKVKGMEGSFDITPIHWAGFPEAR